jgi:hypothetical protein
VVPGGHLAALSHSEELSDVIAGFLGTSRPSAPRPSSP